MKKPAGTKFCCGIPYPHPQCEDCIMGVWDAKMKTKCPTQEKEALSDNEFKLELQPHSG